MTRLQYFALAAMLAMGACGPKPAGDEATLPPPMDSPRPCGGYANGPCPPGSYCHKPPQDLAVADKPGHCRVMPTNCILVLAPVCGEDGKTYGNSCDAAGSGVNVKHTGACKPA